jgi:hypothetical protein
MRRKKAHAKGDNSAQLELILANPAKAFFVDMITRDIELGDAILDLLDNCIDGVRRSGKARGEKPYSKYFATIQFSEDGFTIEDNCGGIPLEIAKKYAFMMGKPLPDVDTKSGTIGVYGIGMKRAIFKMGKSCVVHSHTPAHTFEVAITKEWLEDDKKWDLQAIHVEPVLPKHGTRIAIKDLRPIIKAEFAEGSDFRKKFPGIVRDAYGFLIEKGFTVSVNGQKISPKVPTLLIDEHLGKGSLYPYLFSGKCDHVDVFMAVGFREKPVTNEQDATPHYSSEDAGWTIVCNDRVVLPYDKSKQTGWGWGGIPSYHTQFIAITGFVFFDGDPSYLPMTTTKRGVDANSPLYAEIRERMQSGLSIFTKFTNDWKNFDVKEFFKAAKPIAISELHRRVDEGDIKLNKVKASLSQLLPELPTRPNESGLRRIIFQKPDKDIKRLSQYFFETDDSPASEVGAECFDEMLRKVAKR